MQRVQTLLGSRSNAVNLAIPPMRRLVIARSFSRGRRWPTAQCLRHAPFLAGQQCCQHFFAPRQRDLKEAFCNDARPSSLRNDASPCALHFCFPLTRRTFRRRLCYKNKDVPAAMIVGVRAIPSTGDASTKSVGRDCLEMLFAIGGSGTTNGETYSRRSSFLQMAVRFPRTMLWNRIQARRKAIHPSLSLLSINNVAKICFAPSQEGAALCRRSVRSSTDPPKPL